MLYVLCDLCPLLQLTEFQLLVFKTLPVGQLLIFYERQDSDYSISMHLFFLSQHGICLMTLLWSQQEQIQKKFLVFSKTVCMSWFSALLAQRRALEPVADTCILVCIKDSPHLTPLIVLIHPTLQPLFAFFFCLQEQRAQCSLNL